MQSVVAVGDVIAMLKEQGVPSKKIDSLLESKTFKVERKGMVVTIGVKGGVCIGASLKRQGPSGKLDIAVVDYDADAYPEDERRTISLSGAQIRAAIDRLTPEDGPEATEFVSQVFKSLT